MKSSLPIIGVVAPSFVVPQLELKLGAHRLRSEGYEVRVHPQASSRHLYYAGTDDERARAFFEAASDPEISIVWCARGGYGSLRLLPRLEALARRFGIPGPKLLIGYSDATAILEYARSRWGWSVLHAPMPGTREFSLLDKKHWTELMTAVRGDLGLSHWKLKWIGPKPKAAIEGPLVGGNLSVWASMIGGPFEALCDGKILFLEDIEEGNYRLDRMFQQLLNSHAFRGVKAVVLGTFHGCEDSKNSVFKRFLAGETPASFWVSGAPRNAKLAAWLRNPSPQDLKPLRPAIALSRALADIFGVCAELGIPVAYGLPAGHGPLGHTPLPLGAKYRLSPSGELKAFRWQSMQPVDKPRVLG